MAKIQGQAFGCTATDDCITVEEGRNVGERRLACKSAFRTLNSLPAKQRVVIKFPFRSRTFDAASDACGTKPSAFPHDLHSYIRIGSTKAFVNSFSTILLICCHARKAHRHTVDLGEN